jgi:dienelactone hydrolase
MSSQVLTQVNTARLDPESLVPLPAQLEMEPLPADVPSTIACFHGAWVGVWGDDLRHVLVVESVRPDGSAVAIFANADSSAYAVRASWQRIDATIGAGGLRLSLGYAEVSYEMDGSDRVVGAFANESGQVTPGFFTRLDASHLTSPHVLSTWEIPGERVYIPHSEAVDCNGTSPIKLEARLYRPKGDGSAPLVIFNHGSAIGRNLLDSYSHFGEARWLLDNGFAVLVPMRRGRGLSEGVYGEATYVTSRTGQTIDVSRSINEGIEDLAAAISFGRTLPFVKQGPILLSGQSRGGFLSVVYAGRKPEDVLGVVNFVGGWMGGPALERLNTPYFAEAGKGAGSRVPQLWLYGENDSLYSEAHVRANHAEFEAAGGSARFEFYRGIPIDGHRLRNFPHRWRPGADEFLNGLKR